MLFAAFLIALKRRASARGKKAGLRSHTWEFAPTLLALFAQIAPFLLEYEARFSRATFPSFQTPRVFLFLEEIAASFPFLFAAVKGLNNATSEIAEKESNCRCQIIPQWMSEVRVKGAGASAGGIKVPGQVNDAHGALLDKFPTSFRLDQLSFRRLYVFIYLNQE